MKKEAVNNFPFTQEQIDDRKSDYVCFDCGVQFLTEEQKKGDGRVVTFSVSECCLCNEEKGTTHIRTYNYLRIPKQKELHTEKYYVIKNK